MTETITEHDVDVVPSEGDIPPIFGRCPVCGKPLYPRDRYSDEPKAPPVGAGALSRARCDGCGAIIEYVGGGEWVALGHFRGCGVIQPGSPRYGRPSPRHRFCAVEHRTQPLPNSRGGAIGVI